MRVHIFLIVDFLALGFAVATLYLMYQGLQQHRETRNHHADNLLLQDDLVADAL